VISQKTFGQVFHSKERKCVEKKHFVENYFHFKDDKNYVGGLPIKIHFYVFIKMLDEIKEILPPQKYQNIPQKKYIFLPKVPPP
jgi:hypothetical protein